MSDTFTKWLLGIVATLIVAGVTTTIAMQFSTSNRLAVIEEKLDSDGSGDTMKSHARQHSLHWKYDNYLATHVSRLYQKLGEPIPDPPDLHAEPRP